MTENNTPSPWGDVWLRRLLEIAVLSDAAQDFVRRAAQPIRQNGAREHILRDGVRDSSIRILLSGLACRYKHLPDGRRQITALIVPGDICDFSFLSNSSVSQNVLALSPCTTGLMELDKLPAAVEAHPDIMTAILRAATIEQSSTQELLVSLGARNALHRVGHLLCEMHFRLKIVNLVRPGNVFDLPLTQSELGEILGLSTVHVNRTLQHLRHRGLAIWRDRVVTLPNPDELARLCAFDAGYLRAR